MRLLVKNILICTFNDYPPMLEQITEILSNTILITGLVTVMMMLIECFNVWSKGRLTGTVRKAGLLQIVICTLLGAIPGCMGGFAVVSMFTHGILSFGALIAMMIASSGDEAFVMLAMMPRQALFIMLGLAALAVFVGLVTDRIYKPSRPIPCHCDNFTTHSEDAIRGERHFSWKRLAIVLGVGLFLAALCSGLLEEEHDAGPAEAEFLLGGINLLSEDWMNVLFAIFGVSVLFMAIFASDHFVEEHLWHHVVCEHLPKIFLWTAGTLALISVLMSHIDISSWVSGNTILMIVIAAAVGIIPESGPHLAFVMLYASGIVPLPVLVASCISQDGHAALPLLAEDRKSFLIAKSINFFVAAAVGVVLYLL